MAKKEAVPTLESEDRLQALVAKMGQQFGAGAVTLLGGTETLHVPVIPTGCYSLDRALGVGGMPEGRIVEVYGPEGGGKTTLALHTVAEAQRMGKNAAYIDMEHAMDANYACALGIDLDRLLFIQPDHGEQAIDIMQSLVLSGDIGVMVLDSVAACIPKSELDGKSGESHVGQQARLMGQAMRKLSIGCAKNDTLLILINQLREKVGVMYGSPEVTPGGRAIKFWASIRLDVRRKEIHEDRSGQKVLVKVVKNKVAPPLKEAELDLIYGQGFDQVGSVLDAAEDAGVVTRAGAYYKMNGETLGMGRKATCKKLEECPELLCSVKERLE